jgi:outer membrane immunogenic protein
MRLAATLVAAAVILPTALHAADYHFPGSYDPPPQEQSADFNWGGLYGGIFASYSDAKMNTRSVAKNLASDAYRSSTAQSLAVSIAYLPTDFDQQSPAYGGFIGANWVWDDVVLGLEAEYSGFKPVMTDGGSYSMARRSDGATSSQSVDYTASVRTKISQYGLLKMRAGYAMGRFMPYGVLGAAVGKAEINATYNSLYNEYPMVGGLPDFANPIISNEPANSAYKKRGYVAGGVVGFGFDYALLDNVFVRAEYNYIGFADFNGMKTTLQTVKAGVAVKY